MAIPKIREKIYSKERAKTDFEKLTIKDIREMIGFVEPIVERDNQQIIWQVTTMFEGEGFATKDQTLAYMVANMEEVKALLLNEKKVS